MCCVHILPVACRWIARRKTHIGQRRSGDEIPWGIRSKEQNPFLGRSHTSIGPSILTAGLNMLFRDSGRLANAPNRTARRRQARPTITVDIGTVSGRQSLSQPSAAILHPASIGADPDAQRTILHLAGDERATGARRRATAVSSRSRSRSGEFHRHCPTPSRAQQPGRRR